MTSEPQARELRDRLNQDVRWTHYDFKDDCGCLMCRTAWLSTGGNDGTESLRDV